MAAGFRQLAIRRFHANSRTPPAESERAFPRLGPLKSTSIAALISRSRPVGPPRRESVRGCPTTGQSARGRMRDVPGEDARPRSRRPPRGRRLDCRSRVAAPGRIGVAIPSATRRGRSIQSMGRARLAGGADLRATAQGPAAVRLRGGRGLARRRRGGGREGRHRATQEEHRAPQGHARPAAGAPAARRAGAAAREHRLPLLSGHHGRDRLRHGREVRRDPGAVPRPGRQAAEVRLPRLRGRGRAGARAGPADRGRHADRGGSRPCRGGTLRRPPAAVPPGPGPGTARHRDRPRGAGRLGGDGRLPHPPGGGAAARDPAHLGAAVCRRDRHAGTRPWPGPDQERLCLGDRPR